MADSELIRALMEIFARHSLYAYERGEISQGFLTIRGGHRIGITGKAVVESGHVKQSGYLILKHPHRPRDKGCAKSVLPHLLSGEEFLDTLVISPPGAGKTTLCVI